MTSTCAPTATCLRSTLPHAPVRRRRGCRPASICHWPICARVLPRRPSRPRCSARQPPCRYAGRRPGLGRSLGRWRHRDGGLDGCSPRRRPASGRGDAGSGSPCGLRKPRRGEGRPYGSPFPLAKALADDTLLAFAMTGHRCCRARLPGPCRRAGLRGVRIPKWLRRITVQTIVDNPMQADDYKLFPPDVTARPPILPKATPSRRCRSTRRSASPPRGSARNGGDPRPWVRDRGRPGGRRVDVSATAGAPGARPRWNTRPARLRLDVLGDRAGPSTRRTRTRGARLGLGRADPAGAADDTWNFKGYLSASWHRVRVEVA